MSDIYIPIDYTNLKEVIPLGQEIVYSTFAEIDLRGGNTYTGRGISQIRSKWQTHVLFTKEGLAIFLDRKFINKKEFIPVYYPYYNTGFLLKKLVISADFKEPFRGGITIGGVTMTLSLIKHSKFETKSSFKARSKEFKKTIKSYILEQSKTILKVLYEYFERNPEATYQDYATTTTYPYNEIGYKALKKQWKKGTPLEKYMEMINDQFEKL